MINILDCKKIMENIAYCVDFINELRDALDEFNEMYKISTVGCQKHLKKYFDRFGEDNFTSVCLKKQKKLDILHLLTLLCYSIKHTNFDELHERVEEYKYINVTSYWNFKFNLIMQSVFNDNMILYTTIIKSAPNEFLTGKYSSITDKIEDLNNINLINILTSSYLRSDSCNHIYDLIEDICRKYPGEITKLTIKLSTDNCKITKLTTLLLEFYPENLNNCYLCLENIFDDHAITNIC